MGDCKSNMKKTEKKKTTKKNIFGRKKDYEQKAQNFADMICNSYDKLDFLINIKEKDLEEEKGHEGENRVKLSMLKAMRYHLDAIEELMDEYGDYCE